MQTLILLIFAEMMKMMQQTKMVTQTITQVLTPSSLIMKLAL
jgi:hypothetical protein